jgi:hypothetical protein
MDMIDKPDFSDSKYLARRDAKKIKDLRLTEIETPFKLRIGNKIYGFTTKKRMESFIKNNQNEQ